MLWKDVSTQKTKDAVLQIQTHKDGKYFLLISTLITQIHFISYWIIHMLKFTTIIRIPEMVEWDLGFRPTITEQNFSAENLLIWLEAKHQFHWN